MIASFWGLTGPRGQPDAIGLIDYSAFPISPLLYRCTCVSTGDEKVARTLVVVQPSHRRGEAPGTGEEVTGRHTPTGVIVVGSAASEEDFSYAGPEITLPDGPVCGASDVTFKH